MLDLHAEYKHMQSDIDQAIRTCLEHQKWVLGPEVKELEDSIARYLNVKHCVGVSSGTEALVLSLRALAIKTKGQEYFARQDEIITTPFTFTATGDAILRAGATPVFVDIDPATYNIDPQRISEYLASTAGHRVVGVIPVHLYGQSCEMDKISDIATERNLFIVEDVAQAFGGTWKHEKLGAIGTAGCFSFFPSKNLGGFGDGGMVSTSDDKIAELVRMLLKHGGKDKYNVDHIGYNARLDTLQAAILLAKFKYIDEFNANRAAIAARYTQTLSNVKSIRLPQQLQEAYHVSHQYTINVMDGKRDALQAFLKEKGISSMVYYPLPLHKMTVFLNGRSIASRDLVNAEQAALNVLSLPVEPLQSVNDTLLVTEYIKEFFRKQL